jgi:hypothetical protein
MYLIFLSIVFQGKDPILFLQFGIAKKNREKSKEATYLKK